MKEQKYTFDEGVTLLGGGPATAPQLATAISLAPRLICADGGANLVAKKGPRPEAIIGDLDSLATRADWAHTLGANLVHVAEQDSTDFEKCLRRVEAPFFVGVGFLGGRADHDLAALHALIADPRPIILIGACDVAFAPRNATRLRLSPGDRVSVFPLRPVVASGRGLRWSYEELPLVAAERIGTSNQAKDAAVELTFDRPGAIVMLEAANLNAALTALRESPFAGDKSV